MPPVRRSANRGCPSQPRITAISILFWLLFSTHHLTCAIQLWPYPCPSKDAHSLRCADRVVPFMKSMRSFCEHRAGSSMGAVTPYVSERAVRCIYQPGRTSPSLARSIAMSCHTFPSTNIIYFSTHQILKNYAATDNAPHPRYVVRQDLIQSPGTTRSADYAATDSLTGRDRKVPLLSQCS